MSIQAIAYILGDKDHPGPKVSGATLLTYLSLGNHADERGECWPSVSTICREARLSDKTVRACVRALIKAHEIERIERGAPDARIPADRLTNLYRLTGYLRARGDAPESTGTGSAGTRKRDKHPSAPPQDRRTGTRESGNKSLDDVTKSSSDDDGPQRFTDPGYQALKRRVLSGKPVNDPAAVIGGARRNGHVTDDEGASLLARVKADLNAESMTTQELAAEAARRAEQQGKDRKALDEAKSRAAYNELLIAQGREPLPSDSDSDSISF